jgi:hypothetical protein
MKPHPVLVYTRLVKNYRYVGRNCHSRMTLPPSARYRERQRRLGKKAVGGVAAAAFGEVMSEVRRRDGDTKPGMPSASVAGDKADAAEDRKPCVAAASNLQPEAPLTPTVEPESTSPADAAARRLQVCLRGAGSL